MLDKRAVTLYAISLFLIVCINFTAWTIWANTALERTDYAITSERLPPEFEGFRIAQVADLHCAEYDEDNVKLLSMLRAAEPDIIVFTGDTIDERHLDKTPTIEFLRACADIAPCYMVTGNHESAMRRVKYLECEKIFCEIGINVLHGESVELTRNGVSITLLGVDDENYEGVLHSPEQLRELAGTDSFCILLSHRPEYFWRYAKAQIDLTLSGHAHGGQFRLPLIGGLYAPGQGTLPEYDCGVYTYENANMVVSRGLGQSSFPLRFNNRPELVIVTLHSQSQN